MAVDPVRTGLEDGMNGSHDVALDTLRLLPVLNLLDARTSRLRVYTLAADQLSLFGPHARIDVNVLGCNPQWAVRRILEPAVDLPDDIQENQKGCSHVGFKKGLGIGRSTDWVECDVELGDERNGVYGKAYPRAPNAERGLVWEFIKSVAVCKPAYCEIQSVDKSV